MSILLTALTVALALLAGWLAGAAHTARKAAGTAATLRKEAEDARAEAVKTRTELATERKNSEENRKREAETLRAELRAMSAELVQSQSAALRTQHAGTLEQLLKPLGDDIERFRTQYANGSAALDLHIKQLAEQAASLGRDADTLAKALKGNTKLQGNWGEAVLANLLQASGLTEGRDYDVQVRTPGADGGTAIPDVVVHLPGERNVVIDSKVSLTAYTDYVAAETAAQQDMLLKEHVRSVRQHVKELSAKSYDKLVPHSIGYTLMFVPGEGAYVAAVTACPQLPTEAYAQHVILINPTNLLMALQLAYNLWQSEMQSRSVHEIYASAEKLYKKFTTFAQNFVKIGNGIDSLQRVYTDARKQLSTGRGNIVSQLEAWKGQGLTPPAEIPNELTEEEGA
jgi:DNA recombination protein RmuC